MYDVIIVGGGPAGLSAALVLGRCLKKVLVCDTGKQRNASSNAMHGFITRDCIPPMEFLTIAREQLNPYGVEMRTIEITSGVCHGDYFELGTKEGQLLQCRKLLIATGVKDYLPELEGIDQFYGKSVHHCPYCDGWEDRQKPLVAYGLGRVGIGLSLSLKTWSDEVTLCTDGSRRLTREDYALLHRNGVKVDTAKIARLVGTGTQLERLEFTNGSYLICHSMYFVMGTVQHSTLAKQMNCTFTKRGVVKNDNKQKTNVRGLYVAGDAARDMQQVIIAAAEGAKAAIAINMEFQDEMRK